MKELRRLLDAKRRQLAQLTREVTALEHCLAEMGNVAPRRLPRNGPPDPEGRKINEAARARISAEASARWEELRQKTAKRRRALARRHP